MPVFRFGATFRDDKGLVASPRGNVLAATLADGVTAAGAVIDAIDNMTNANEVQRNGILAVGNPNPAYGTNANFESCEDKGVMTYKDSVGATHRIEIPAPMETIFAADGITVDPTDALVIALNDAVIGNMCSPAGTSLTVFVGGRRSFRKSARINNLKTPALA